MSIFRNKFHYKMPERLTPSEARERRLTAMLEKEQRFQQVPNFQRQLEAVRSQAQKERVKTTLSRSTVNDDKAYRQKAASIAAALSKFKERDFANPQARADYRRLRAAQEAHLAAAASVNRRSSQKVPPSGGNKSYFNPTGKEYAATLFGTAARLSGRLNPLSSNWLPVFRGASAVLPCIERLVRKEVMFAKGYAGRGYRVRHRRSWSSGIPC